MFLIPQRICLFTLLPVCPYFLTFLRSLLSGSKGAVRGYTDISHSCGEISLLPALGLCMYGYTVISLNPKGLKHTVDILHHTTSPVPTGFSYKWVVNVCSLSKETHG